MCRKMNVMMMLDMMITYKEYEICEQDQILENIWYEPVHCAARFWNKEKPCSV